MQKEKLSALMDGETLDIENNAGFFAHRTPLQSNDERMPPESGTSGGHF